MSHPCRNYCSQWTGEQCKGCMISDEAELQDPPAVEYCPHGYDTACLICGFGTKDGERVWHNNKPKKTVASVCTEAEPIELFNTKHCSPRNYIKQYYSNVTDAQRLKDLDASVEHAKAALATFNYDPLPTPRELKQAEQIRILRTDRNVWCAMFFIAVVGYGVARWML